MPAPDRLPYGEDGMFESRETPYPNLAKSVTCSALRQSTQKSGPFSEVAVAAAPQRRGSKPNRRCRAFGNSRSGAVLRARPAHRLAWVVSCLL